MKVLVTGGAGYIGSHAVRSLVKEGHEVFVYDNLSTGFKESLPKETRFFLGDILDSFLLGRVMKDQKIEAVFHLAGKLNTLESFEQPLNYYECNALGMMNLIKTMKTQNVPYLVYSSSAAIYCPSQENEKLKEESLKKPSSPYGKSKLLAEQLLSDLAEDSGIRYSILRYFNAAGAASDGSNGQRTSKAFHLVHLAAKAAAGKIEKINLFGEDYNTPDGTCVRDFIHVEDLAEIHNRALTYLTSGKKSDTFNCGYGRGYSVKEVISMMEKVSGRKIKVEKANRRMGDIASLVADNEKIKKQFEWNPASSGLEKICLSAFNWELNSQN